MSAATLLLLRPWLAMLPTRRLALEYFVPLAVTRTWVAAMLALQVGVTLACLAALLILWPRFRRLYVLRAALLLAALIFVLNPLRLEAAEWFPILLGSVAQARLGTAGFWVLVLLLLLGCLGTLLRWPARAERFLSGALLILAPLPLVLLVSILPGLQDALPLAPQITQRPDGPAPPRQLYLLIFDEWDYGWTFAHRPEALTLPNLEALLEESFQADRAYPPSNSTSRSIPSLLTGILFSEGAAAPRQNYRLKVAESGQWVTFSDLDDLPREASRLGRRTLLLDCYHSYPAEYQRQRPLLDLHRLPWFVEQGWAAGFPGGLAGPFDYFANLALMTTPGLVWFAPSLNELLYRRQLLQNLETRLLAEARNPQHDLVIAHLPIPHAPALDGSDPRFPGAFANMPLMDAVIGRLRRQLEAAGRWDRTTLILTSDHWQRKKTATGLPGRPAPYDTPDLLRRVPFVVWMPDHPRGEHSGTPMNNRIVYPLIQAWLRNAPLTAALVEAEAYRIPPQGFYDHDQ